MRNYKNLSIDGVLLDKNQIQNLFEKLAINQVIQNYSNKNTYPIPELKKDYNRILETYNLLSRHLKLGIKIHSAGEWILDNFYIIEENFKYIQNELTLKKYKNLNGIAEGEYKGFSRAYVLASILVSYTDCNINEDIIRLALSSYQNKKLLSMDEISNFGIFLKIAEISHIRKICEKIIISQNQKYKVESIIENLVEKKNLKDRIFTNKVNIKYSSKTELKFSFIEYMSYRLRKYGKNAIAYQNILEQEVLKLGLTISDIIQKEHYQIANLKVVLGNCIKSIKDIGRINFDELLNEINGIEDILFKDPANVYQNMEQESKSYYRTKIENIAKKFKISEVYISNKLIELASRYTKDDIKSHIGYYLLKDGYSELLDSLQIKHKRFLNQNQISKLYISLNFGLTIYIDFIFAFITQILLNNLILSIFQFVILYIPISEIIIRIMNYILLKLKAPTLIPKLDFESEIPEQYTTMVVIPTILGSEDKVKKMFKKLEVYYNANNQNNLYFTLLGDCTESEKETENIDKVLIEAGIKEAERLNQKYNTNIFGFIFRKRRWNSGENKFIGWERKRGLLYSFNLFLQGKVVDDFLANNIDKDIINKIKYIITLDSDTNLIFDSASKMIGAMAHILNRPVLKGKKVISGYGIMQPRVGLDLSQSNISKFVQLYSTEGGIDFYTNAISDIYQDYFKEGIFTGKGIYDLNVYNTVLKDEFPENTILSHDLLEGNYLRCGLLSDIELLDGFPSKYLSYINRNHRWVRGDFQIASWIKNKKLNKISRFKIFDNLRRSLLKPMVLIGLIFGFILDNNIMIFTSLISLEIMYLLEILNYIIFKKSNIIGAIYSNRNFSRKFEGVFLAIIRIILDFIFLPFEAYKNIDAIIRVIYRKIRKTKLLEWVTSEDVDKNCSNKLSIYYKEMFIQVIFGAITFILNQYFIGILWIIAPFVAYEISKDNKEKTILSKDDELYLLSIAKDTWKFFIDNITKENNYLIIDNYQDDRRNKIVRRTSSTNIGLELISVISAYDLGFIKLDQCIDYLYKIFDSINKLSKWNGHLYNWYNTEDLKPLIPRFISTVDSGNFVGYLYIVRQFLIENNEKKELDNLIQNVDNLINNTDFSYLYSEKNKLFSVGFNLEENELIDSYYDFLASEARQASVVAIAKRDVPLKHWNNLSRTLTVFKGYKGLVSWTGTAFEYLMPNINLKQYEGSLIDESSRFAVLSQMEYCSRYGIPWGISESAYNTKDFNSNYQYKAFGIPWLGLKRGLEEDLVISPYSTCLALPLKLKSGIKNLKKLEEYGVRGNYGFFESIDFTPNRLKVGDKYEVVKTYMAHHQGLILNSLNNVINKNVLQNRFNKDAKIEAVNILLQEKMPLKMIITKDKKKKVEKLKNENLAGYCEREIKEFNFNHKNINIISNENYKVYIDNFGNGYSKYKNKLLTEFKPTISFKQGIFFYLKSNKRILSLEENCKVIFAPDKAIFSKTEGNLKMETKITVNPNEPMEVRNIKISNVGNTEEILDLYCELIPILSNDMEHYAHPCFNKMFIKYEKIDDIFVITKKQKDSNENLNLAVCLYSDKNQIIENSFEVDKEKFYGRDNLGIPLAIVQNRKLDNNIIQSVDSMLAIKNTFKLKSNEEIEISLLLSVNEDKKICLENINSLKGKEEINKLFDLSRIRVEEELKYLRLNSETLINSMKLLDFIYDDNLPKLNQRFENVFEYNSIWKYGISGDYPIILFDINSIDDIYIFEEFLDIYIFYRTKNIFIDIVILLYEKNIYEHYLLNSIEEIIQNKQISYLKNQKSGIYVINRNEVLKEDLEFIYNNSKLKFDRQKGTLKNYIKDIEEKLNNKETTEKIELREFEEEILPCNIETKDFYNGIGGFLDNGKEYVFAVNKDSKTPSVWSNVISNKFFGSIVTENMADSTWCKNSRLNRLTPWNNNGVQNLPSEIIYVFEKSKKRVWTLNSGVIPNNNYYYCTYGFGYAKYRNITDGILQETNIYIPSEDKVKVTDIRFKNIYDEDRVLNVVFLSNLVIGEDEFLTNKNLIAKFNNNTVYIKNTIPSLEFKNNIMFISSNEKINKISFRKDDLLENGDYRKPIKILNKKNDFCNSVDCVILEFQIKLNSFEEKNLIIQMGEERESEKINDYINKYNNIDFVKNDLEQTKKNWRNLLNGIWITTPSKELDYLFNGWLGYQTISSRIFSRSSFYQSGGAIGFRDQLQDTLGMKFLNSDLLKDQILKCSAHQFIDGDVLHWWHDETKRGIRTRFSDDLLWLPYSVIEYIQFTNDYSFLDEQVEYLSGNLLSDNEQEKYDIYYNGKEKESIYQHCIRAIERSLNFGENGFPKIGSGDWNDGFSNVGVKGKGESIWLGFFLYDILNRFEDILKYKNDIEKIEKYNNIKMDLKKKLNTVGWDGKWYKRAIDDEGNSIGSIECDECKIDGISQSWAVISDCGDNDKKYICLENAENYLVDRENKIIKLFTPAFENSKLEPGYIKSYPAGVRENGGQYTHGALWLAMAYFRLGLGDKGYELLSILNPINHSQNIESLSKYKKEPYVVSADVYSSKDMQGRGGWSWYTGSSSWFYKIIIEELLGLKIKNGYAIIDPCIPKKWKNFEIHYKHKTSMYNFKINNFEEKNKGVQKVILNNEILKDKKIFLQNDGKIYNVEVFM